MHCNWRAIVMLELKAFYFLFIANDGDDDDGYNLLWNALTMFSNLIL